MSAKSPCGRVCFKDEVYADITVQERKGGLYKTLKTKGSEVNA